MSEVTLILLDANCSLQGSIHGSQADRAMAALAAEPETIEELDDAMRRFTGENERSHFGWFHPGDSAEPWDAGIVIIDLAARLLAGDSTYSGITTAGSVSGLMADEWVNFRLSNDWDVSRGADYWRSAARRRREERAAQPRIDTRQVLFGRPMLKFIAGGMAQASGLEADLAVRKVHADWLLTARDDLAGRSPREVLLAKKNFIDLDLQFRSHQWTTEGKCPTGLRCDTAAFNYAGFGTHENVLYYEMMRFLLWECRERISQERELNRTDETMRLEKLMAAWLETPDPEFHGRTPASIIDNERRRIPEGMTGAESVIDPDCACCQMMAEENFGPMFWHLDGCNMDEEFAFSFHSTLEEWQEEQLEWAEFSREIEEREATRELDRDSADQVWARTFVDDELKEYLPLGQLVPVANFGFAAMIAELNQDLGESAIDPADAAAQQESLNRLLGNFRDALADNADLIDPTLDRLVEELAGVAEQYPHIGDKCADLSRRLRNFPEKLVEAAERTWEDDVPF